MSPASPDLVYVVDDDEDVRYSVKILLERAGFAVRDFPDAQSCLAAASDSEQFGCLLVDMHMPGLSGVDLLRRLKALGVQVPAIVMSGNYHLESELAGLDVFQVLSKPAPTEDVLGWVGKACAQARASAGD